MRIDHSSLPSGEGGAPQGVTDEGSLCDDKKMILKTPVNKKDKFTSNKKLTSRSKDLRKNMTPEEKHLWYDFLKNLDVNINRQKVVGIYILDFYCDEYKLAIEIDGNYHLEGKQKKHDKIRDDYLSSLGIKVLRYSNEEINNHFLKVCENILEKMI